MGTEAYEDISREEIFEVEDQKYAVDIIVGHSEDEDSIGIDVRVNDFGDKRVCSLSVRLHLLNQYDPFTVAGTVGTIYGLCVFQKNGDLAVKVLGECLNSARTSNPDASIISLRKEIYECVIGKKSTIKSEVFNSLISCLSRIFKP